MHSSGCKHPWLDRPACSSAECPQRGNPAGKRCLLKNKSLCTLLPGLSVWGLCMWCSDDIQGSLYSRYFCNNAATHGGGKRLPRTQRTGLYYDGTKLSISRVYFRERFVSSCLCQSITLWGEWNRWGAPGNVGSICLQKNHPGCYGRARGWRGCVWWCDTGGEEVLVTAHPAPLSSHCAP